RAHGTALLLALPVLPVATVNAASAASPPIARPAVPRFSHVVEVFLENESAGSTWEDEQAAPHLAALRRENVYIPAFFAAGHASLSNYEAAFGAVEPTSQGKADCLGMP